MAAANDNASMALFCDFENIALGVRDAQYEKFDIRPILERLLAKGSIVVKKAYCDWERYKGFKAAMHEANFELIEIPHVRQSGKNSADIRMVVDALDLCYTKSHVDTFVIISGDSDFSPLVSKLRENAKRVIGVGVKQSCSDLLITNCDEFIYYDDLVRDRDAGRGGQRRERDKRSPEEEDKRREKMEERKAKAVDLAATTFADMMADRGESERIWASVLKEVIKRRNPGFNESYYGFRNFGNLLEEAASRGLLAVGRDEKSGTYVTRAQHRPVEMEPSFEAAPAVDSVVVEEIAETPVAVSEDRSTARRRGGRRGRKEGKVREAAVELPPVEFEVQPAAMPEAPVVEPVELESAGRRQGGRRGRKDGKVREVAAEQPPTEVPVVESVEPDKPAKAGKPARGARRPRKGASEQPEAAASVIEVPAMAAEVPAAPPVETGEASAKPRRGGRRSREAVQSAPESVEPVAVAVEAPARKKSSPRKAAEAKATAPKTARPRKPKAAPTES